MFIRNTQRIHKSTKLITRGYILTIMSEKIRFIIEIELDAICLPVYAVVEYFSFGDIKINLSQT